MFVDFSWHGGGREGGREGAANNNNPTWVRWMDAAMAISYCTSLEVLYYSIHTSGSEGNEDR